VLDTVYACDSGVCVCVCVCVCVRACVHACVRVHSPSGLLIYTCSFSMLVAHFYVSCTRTKAWFAFLNTRSHPVNDCFAGCYWNDNPKV
jgi:hypothetical protein